MTLLLPSKVPEEGRCEATLVKLVLSVWPQFSVTGRYVTAICNVSATVRIATTSTQPLTRLLFLITHAAQARPSSVLDISHTLLDGRNPLTYTTRGRFQKKAGSDRLLAYDGVSDVSVDCDTTLAHRHVPNEPLGRIAVRFSRPLAPGQTAAVRYCFETPGLFAESVDGALHFELPIQDDSVIRQFVSDATLARIGVPILTVARDEVSGGVDVFFYMPVDFVGERFTIDPLANLLPDYDHLGRRQQTPRRKFAWTGKALRDSPGSVLELGDNLSIAGTFRRRKPMSDDSPSISGPIIINSRISRSSVVHAAGSARVNSSDALRLLAQLREQSEVLPPEEADLMRTHVDGMEASIRRSGTSRARRRLAPLRKLAGSFLDTAPRVMDLVERLDRVL